MSSLNLPTPLTVLPSVTCQQSIDIMDRFDFIRSHINLISVNIESHTRVNWIFQLSFDFSAWICSESNGNKNGLFLNILRKTFSQFSESSK